MKKKKALVKISFEETMQLLETLLIPIVEAIKNDEKFDLTWNRDQKSWM